MKHNIRRKDIALACMLCCGTLMIGCGKSTETTLETQAQTIEFAEFLSEESEPVIVRDNTVQTESEPETDEQSETQTEEIVPFADRYVLDKEGGQAVNYQIEDASYEEGVAKIVYPQFSNMENQELQAQINENIKNTMLKDAANENLESYELKYETTTAGAGIVSFIIRGTASYVDGPYPTNIVKTLNIDMTTGNNLRLKDYADIAEIVSGLEMESGYDVCGDGIDKADFGTFLNNGYVTDYAITMLDYDIDLNNQEMRPTGYSCIRDNHVVLFIEAEHAMGDYVEVIFEKEL